MELLAEVRDGSNSGKPLLSIHASSAESEGTAAFVSSRASSRCLRFIDPIDSSSSIGEFVLGSGEVFSGEPPPLLHLGFLRVFYFLVRAGPLSLPSPLPGGGATFPPPPLRPRWPARSPAPACMPPRRPTATMPSAQPADLSPCALASPFPPFPW
jgi:hypothetical protein